MSKTFKEIEETYYTKDRENLLARFPYLKNTNPKYKAIFQPESFYDVFGGDNVYLDVFDDVPF